MIDNRGVMVHLPGLAAAETFLTDSFRCRFMAEGQADRGNCRLSPKNASATPASMSRMTASLRTYDGQAGYSLAQGQ